MEIREVIDDKYRKEWNQQAKHPLQAWEWGEFRELTSARVVRYGIFDKNKLVNGLQVTIHPIPHTKWTVGYYPKGIELTNTVVNVLKVIADKNNCIYIKCEPKVENNEQQKTSNKQKLSEWGFADGRPLFTKYNFVLDVSKNESELLAAMKQKTRYNIRMAEKKGVTVSIDNSPQAFEKYLQLTDETTNRQGFYAHGREYHKKMWKVLSVNDDNGGRLTANILTAKYNGQIITTWVLFKFGDTLYYPYGASTRENREVMANNLVMWEAIRHAKKWNLAYLDMWGALGPEADPKDPWYGFHTFKAGYGAKLVEYIGTYDWVAKPVLYKIYRIAETVRWWILRLKK